MWPLYRFKFSNRIAHPKCKNEPLFLKMRPDKLIFHWNQHFLPFPWQPYRTIFFRKITTSDVSSTRTSVQNFSPSPPLILNIDQLATSNHLNTERLFHIAEWYFPCFVSIDDIWYNKCLSNKWIYRNHIFLVISRYLAVFLETDLKMQMDQIVPNTSPTMCVNRLKWVHTTKLSFIAVFIYIKMVYKNLDLGAFTW